MELKLLSKKEYEDLLESFNQLFKLTFKRDIHPDYLRWRYLENPFEDLLVAVAIDNNKIVANYSASPCNFTFEGNKYKAALSMTTMTHPDYNGRGLFTDLAKLLYSEMEKRGYSMIWGFPNNNSHGIFRTKLEWEDIYEIPTFTLNLQNVKDVAIDEKYFFEFDNDFKNIDIYSNAEKIQVERNAEYYKWRYLNNPVNEYINYSLFYENKHIANVIYKNYGDSVDLVELKGESDEIKLILLKRLIQNLKEQGKSNINCWLNVNSSIYTSFEKLGFQNSAPITYFGGRQLKEGLKYNNYKLWDISMGDSDVY